MITVLLQKHFQKARFNIEHPVFCVLALAIHHCIMCFHFGVELSEGKSSKLLKRLYSIGFSHSISLGIGVGIGITSSVTENLPNSLNILIVKGNVFFIHM